MSSLNPEYDLCSDCSLAVGEPLTATAPRNTHWILLEYHGPWGADPLPASTLPDAVKAHLRQELAALPDARFQFIKRTHVDSDIRVYAAVTGPGQNALYSIDLVNIEEVLLLDFAAILAGQFPEFRRSEHLVLTCTNGKKDIACAKNGLPLAQALERDLPYQAWQTTHIGGHRFAGTLVMLPDGVYYGRVSAAQVPEIVAALRTGQIAPAYYRGRSGWPAPAQAAETALRQRLQMWDLKAVTLEGMEAQGENQWLVTLKAGDASYPLWVTGALSAFETQESSADPARKPMMQYAVQAG